MNLCHRFVFIPAGMLRYKNMPRKLNFRAGNLAFSMEFLNSLYNLNFKISSFKRKSLSNYSTITLVGRSNKHLRGNARTADTNCFCSTERGEWESFGPRHMGFADGNYCLHLTVDRLTMNDRQLLVFTRVFYMVFHHIIFSLRCYRELKNH